MVLEKIKLVERPKGDYSVTKRYVAMLGEQNRVKEADLIWNLVMMETVVFVRKVFLKHSIIYLQNVIG